MAFSSAEFEFGGSPPPRVLCTDEERPRKLLNNALDLAGYAYKLAAQWSPSGRLQLTPEMILECGRLTNKGILDCAGQWRDRFVDFEGYAPPHWKAVQTHVDHFCEYANS